jgi:hypothetical protein
MHRFFLQFFEKIANAFAAGIVRNVAPAGEETSLEKFGPLAFRNRPLK